jgi:peptidoglycan/xylan/chitin deacetylase (PgdA/CDA1 family)
VRTHLLARLLDITQLRRLLSVIVRWSGVLCLNYHRIGDGQDSVFERGLWSATAEAFNAQIGFLTSHCDIITLEDLPNVTLRGKGRHVLVTFDDGYEDNFRLAFPILKAHGVKASFFICTGFLDRPRLPWWDEIAWMVRTSQKAAIEIHPYSSAPIACQEPDRERSIRQLLRIYKTIPFDSTESFLTTLATATGTGRYSRTSAGSLWMTWDMVREMRGAGMSIGGHTVDHPILGQMSREQQQFQIEECGRRLATELGEPMRSFSYPVGKFGAFNASTRECLQTLGVRYAFSFYGGFNHFSDWDSLDIRRTAIEQYLTPSWFRSIVSLPQFFAREVAK